MYILGQMRGGILSMAATIGLFFLMKRKMKYVSYIVIGAIAYQFVISPMFEYRTRDAQTSTFAEIVNVVKDPTNVYQKYSTGASGGTFAFRIATLSERIIFMCHNPQYFPFGVGCIHEDSDANTFYFNLGTHNENFKNNKETIGSADITWVEILMRYGLIGVLLYLLLLYAWAKKGIPQIKNSDDAIFITCTVFVISVILGSFNGDNLGRVPSILNILFYLAVIYRYNYDKKRDILFNRLRRENEKRIEQKV
jgi:hypothetical protein